MMKKQRKSGKHFVVNIYASGQAKKHASSDVEYIRNRISGHHKRSRSETYYVLTIYKKNKPIHKHKSGSALYILRNLK